MTATIEHTDSIGREALVRRDRGALGDAAFRRLTAASSVAVLAILALIVVTMTREAVPALRVEGLDFFTTKRWAPSSDVYGALAFVYGTVVVSAISLLLAVPVSVGVALFTTEVAPRRLRSSITMVIDLLAAIPSVVYGLWGILVLAPEVVGVYRSMADLVDPVPGLRVLFGQGATGRSYMTAGIVVAVMITPIITSITREVLTMVPQGEKDAALALGATRWEMIKGAVLPHGFGGVVGAIMLGLGRALGETIAIALTIGSSIQITGNLLKSGTAMPEVIVLQWGESSETHRSALIALGLMLFVITIAVNMLARAIVNRTQPALQGG